MRTEGVRRVDSKIAILGTACLVLSATYLTYLQLETSASLHGTLLRQKVKLSKVWRRHGTDAVAVDDQEEAPQPGFTIFTTSSDVSDNLIRLQNSTTYDIAVLGLDQQWQGFRSKVMNLMRHLRYRNDSDIIMWVDSADVLFFPCGRDLVQEFESMQADIVFQHDWISWPEHNDQYKLSFYPPVPHKARMRDGRFLCAGAWMGRVGAVRYLVSEYFLRTGAVDDPKFDDQMWWRNLFLSQYYNGGKPTHPGDPHITLDYYGRIFQEFRPRHWEWEVHNDWPLWVVDPVTGRVTCPEYYDVDACIVHAPGPQESVKQKFWQSFYPLYTWTLEVAAAELAAAELAAAELASAELAAASSANDSSRAIAAGSPVAASDVDRIGGDESAEDMQNTSTTGSSSSLAASPGAAVGFSGVAPAVVGNIPMKRPSADLAGGPGGGHASSVSDSPASAHPQAAHIGSDRDAFENEEVMGQPLNGRKSRGSLVMLHKQQLQPAVNRTAAVSEFLEIQYQSEDGYGLGDSVDTAQQAPRNASVTGPDSSAADATAEAQEQSNGQSAEEGMPNVHPGTIEPVKHLTAPIEFCCWG